MNDYPEEHVVPATPLSAAEVARLCLGRFRLGSWIIAGLVVAHGLVFRWLSLRDAFDYMRGFPPWFPLYKWSVLEFSPMLLAIASASLFRYTVETNAVVREHCAAIPNGIRDVGFLAIRRLVWMTVAVAAILGFSPVIVWLASNPQSIRDADVVTACIPYLVPTLGRGLLFLSYLLLALVIALRWKPWAVVLGVILTHVAMAVFLGPSHSRRPYSYEDGPATWPALVVHLILAAVCLYRLRAEFLRHGQPTDPESALAPTAAGDTNPDAKRALTIGLLAIGMFLLQYLTLGFMTGGRRQWTIFVWVLFGLMGASVVTGLIALWFAGRSLYDPNSKRWKVGCALLLALLAILGTLAMLALFYLVAFSISMGAAG